MQPKSFCLYGILTLVELGQVEMILFDQLRRRQQVLFVLDNKLRRSSCLLYTKDVYVQFQIDKRSTEELCFGIQGNALVRILVLRSMKIL